MENASKALIIAAGMLIGLIIASLFTYEMIHMAQSAREYQENFENTKIVEFNQQFRKYTGRKDLTSQDIVTIIGFINEWNSQSSETITPETHSSVGTSTELYKYIKKINPYNSDNNERDELFLTNNSSSKYSCTLSFNTKAGGRVNKVTFKYE